MRTPRLVTRARCLQPAHSTTRRGRGAVPLASALQWSYLIEVVSLKVMRRPNSMVSSCHGARLCVGVSKRSPRPSSATALARMLHTRRRDTNPEMTLRREVHRRGLRYRVDAAPLHGFRRRVDLLFPSTRVAVFVDGCFWHVCPRHASWPRANAAWWRTKLLGNVRRDRDTDRRLRAAGWIVIRVWECSDVVLAAERIARAVRRRSV